VLEPGSRSTRTGSAWRSSSGSRRPRPRSAGIGPAVRTAPSRCIAGGGAARTRPSRGRE